MTLTLPLAVMHAHTVFETIAWRFSAHVALEQGNERCPRCAPYVSNEFLL